MFEQKISARNMWSLVILGKFACRDLLLKHMIQLLKGPAFGLWHTTPYMINPDEGNLRGKTGFIFGGFSVIACIWTYLPSSGFIM
jgi:hypothetical protein